MRLAFSLGSLLKIEDVRYCITQLSKNEPDTIWIPETWGMENFAMLGAAASLTNKAKIGSSIINIYSRSPSLVAMGAATIDQISAGRMVLGLGASSQPIVEDFHGYAFESPITRIKEYVEIVRLALSGEVVNYEGQYFRLKNFRLLIKPQQTKIPIYLAAINQKMVELAWSIADGVIFYLRPKNELTHTIQKMQAKKKIDVACQIITAISDDSQNAITRAKKTLSFYIAVGDIYRNFLAKNGYKKETTNVYAQYKKTGLKGIEEQIPDAMIKDLTICGTPEMAKKQLKNFRETGIDLPIIQFNPVGSIKDSFELLQETFLEIE